MTHLVHDLIGASPALAKVIEFIAKAATLKASVLLQGESGTGKELVARAIHRNSARSNGPFVAVNCAALAQDVLENELFGHEREAFTGAQSQKPGKFELASGGTLFLDEIGEIGPTPQAKLLRAVEYGEIQKVGGGRTIHADVRLIAATNRNLAQAVAEGDFREDLYYRLSVLPIRLPPLHERREDIPILVRRFIATSEAAAARGVTDISADAAGMLSNYDWPGNVRQLKHVLERAAAFAGSPTLQPHDVAAILAEQAGARRSSKPKTMEEAAIQAKRRFVENAVEISGGNLRKAAEIVGKSQRTFWKLLDRLNLSYLKSKSGGRNEAH
jgi:transcriptional regulator with GAF, ATPase, and Fis domain